MSESEENYLGTIFILKKRMQSVRSIDIANHLGYSRASVSRALKNLRLNGYLQFGAENAIEFTQKGLEAASGIYERHTVISEFLQKSIGIDANQAAQYSGPFAHVISEETYCKMKLSL
jgi:DtxR family Mn-dependent transcriptional regulator